MKSKLSKTKLTHFNLTYYLFHFRGEIIGHSYKGNWNFWISKPGKPYFMIPKNSHSTHYGDSFILRGELPTLKMAQSFFESRIS